MTAIFDGLIAFLCCAGIVALFHAFAPDFMIAVLMPKYGAKKMGEEDVRRANQN